MRFSVRTFVFSLLIFVFSSLLFISSSFAQTPQTNQPKEDLHNWTQNVMIEVMSSLTCQLAGVDPVNPSQKCLGIANGKIGPVDSTGGAVGVMGNLIAMTFTPPLHTGDYVRYLAGNFGISKPAYAQGIGFQGLSPLISVWTAFRNIAYLLFILIFVAIGLAIMLRVKIDPRTVMAVENQIPKIIIGLILVTFSFAIAGFVIDLMYVFIYLVFGVFSQIPRVGDSLKDLNPALLQGKNAIEAAGGVGGIFGFATTITSSVIGVMFSFFGLEGPLGGVVDKSPMNIFIHAISGGVGIFMATQGAQIPLGILSNLIPGVTVLSGAPLGLSAFTGTEFLLRNILPNLIVFLVVTLAMLFALFRLWFTLIKAYVFILIDVVFAPFWIIAGLVPGSNLSFSTWLRDIGANLIAFPATIVMFLLGKVFIDAFAKASPNEFFVPPLIGHPGSPNLIGALIGFGIILMTPTVVEMMKAALKAPKFDISAIGAAVGVGTGGLTSSVTGGPKYASALGEASRAQGGIMNRYRRFMGELRFPGSRL